MLRWLQRRRPSPIGVDIGARSVKLVQFDGDHTSLLEASRAELPALSDKATPAERSAAITQALEKALTGKAFRGREAVVCLNDRHLFVQNVRVARSEGAELDRLVAQEAAGKIPYSVAETELRYFEAADVRQGENTLREVILLACHRPILDEMLKTVDNARLQPVAVDVEPAAIVRSYAIQFRRDEDRKQRALLVHLGYSRSVVTITQGDDVLFTKYIDIGGVQFDAAVARHLKMELPDAVALRRHSFDRRAEQQDAQVLNSVADAMRPAVERLLAEISMCVRYHSVTFRGQPLVRLTLSGGEATPALLEQISKQFDFRCELSDPFRPFAVPPHVGRRGQWDVAAGLALREMN